MSRIFAGPVERRVMSVMRKRIDDAEAEHDRRVAEIDEAHDQEIDKVNERREASKGAVADTLVESIIGKIA